MTVRKATQIINWDENNNNNSDKILIMMKIMYGIYEANRHFRMIA